MKIYLILLCFCGLFKKMNNLKRRPIKLFIYEPDEHGNEMEETEDMFALERKYPQFLRENQESFQDVLEILRSSPETAHFFLVPHRCTDVFNACLIENGFHLKRTDPLMRFCKMFTLSYFMENILMPLKQKRSWEEMRSHHIFLFAWDFGVGIFGNLSKIPKPAVISYDADVILNFIEESKNLRRQGLYEFDVYSWPLFQMSFWMMKESLSPCLIMSPFPLQRPINGPEYDFYYAEKQYIYFPPFLNNWTAIESFRPIVDAHFSIFKDDPTYFGYFRGSIHNNTRYSQGVRQKLPALSEISFDYLVETQFRNDYILEMGHSRFCLCPGGWAPWSPRFIESLLIGCIPVIMADDLEFPKISFLNREEYLILIPQNITMAELDGKLRSVDIYQIIAMRKKALEVCRFYNPFSKEFAQYIANCLCDYGQ